MGGDIDGDDVGDRTGARTGVGFFYFGEITLVPGGNTT
jgi:hypothetical protein